MDRQVGRRQAMAGRTERAVAERDRRNQKIKALADSTCDRAKPRIAAIVGSKEKIKCPTDRSFFGKVLCPQNSRLSARVMRASIPTGHWRPPASRSGKRTRFSGLS